MRITEEYQVISEILQDIFDDFDITYWDHLSPFGNNRVWSYESYGIVIYNASPPKWPQSWTDSGLREISKRVGSCVGRIKEATGRNIHISIAQGKKIDIEWAIDLQISIR